MTLSPVGYVEKKGRSFSQIQHEESEEEDDEMFSELAIGGSKGGKRGQAKLNFSKAAPKKKAPAKKKTTAAASKGKGKAKQIVLDSDDEENEDSGVGSSNTLKGDTMDLDDDDDDDDGFGGRGSKASSSSSRRKPTPATSTAKRPTRKTAPQTIMIDDSESDSDSGLTFKVSNNPFSPSLDFATLFWPTFGYSHVTLKLTLLSDIY